MENPFGFLIGLRSEHFVREVPHTKRKVLGGFGHCLELGLALREGAVPANKAAFLKAQEFRCPTRFSACQRRTWGCRQLALTHLMIRVLVARRTGPSRTGTSCPLGRGRARMSESRLCPDLTQRRPCCLDHRRTAKRPSPTLLACPGVSSSMFQLLGFSCRNDTRIMEGRGDW